MLHSLPNSWSDWTIPPPGQPIKLWRKRKVAKTTDEFKTLRDNINATNNQPIVIDGVSVIFLFFKHTHTHVHTHTHTDKYHV